MLRLRRLRSLPALLALVCMLCMQLALAAGVCRPPAAAHPCVCADGDDGGAGRIAALCQARCHPDERSLDSRLLPPVVALAPPPALLAILEAPTAQGPDVHALAVRPDLRRAAGPPISIAHCCLRN